MFNSDAAIAELAKSVDELAGKVVGLIAYVGHLPRADSVRPEEVKGLVRPLTKIAKSEHPALPLHHAEQTVTEIHSMARSVATLRSAGSPGS